jgi:hypothetical protein
VITYRVVAAQVSPLGRPLKEGSRQRAPFEADYELLPKVCTSLSGAQAWGERTTAGGFVVLECRSGEVESVLSERLGERPELLPVMRAMMKGMS